MSDNFLYYLPNVDSASNQLAQGNLTTPDPTPHATTDGGLVTATGSDLGFSQSEIDQINGLISVGIRTLNDRIIVATGQIQSQNFVTGVAGWQIDSAGNMEGNNAFFRTSILVGSIALNKYLQFTGGVLTINGAIINGGTGVSGFFTNGTFIKDMTDASTTQTIAHGLGTTPKLVSISWSSPVSSTLNANISGNGTYNGTNQNCRWEGFDVNGGVTIGGVDTKWVHYDNGSAAGFGGNTQNGVVSWDATNITITWTKTAFPSGTCYFLWEAEA